MSVTRELGLYLCCHDGSNSNLGPVIKERWCCIKQYVTSQVIELIPTLCELKVDIKLEDHLQKKDNVFSQQKQSVQQRILR